METSPEMEDERRRRVVIAAAAAVAVGAPVRILDIQLAQEPSSRWLRGGRGINRAARRPVWLHRAGAPKKDEEQSW
jgi:hypothetical protein